MSHEIVTCFENITDLIFAYYLLSDFNNYNQVPKKSFSGFTIYPQGLKKDGSVLRLYLLPVFLPLCEVHNFNTIAVYRSLKSATQTL